MSDILDRWISANSTNQNDNQGARVIRDVFDRSLGHSVTLLQEIKDTAFTAREWNAFWIDVKIALISIPDFSTEVRFRRFVRASSILKYLYTEMGSIDVRWVVDELHQSTLGQSTSDPSIDQVCKQLIDCRGFQLFKNSPFWSFTNHRMLHCSNEGFKYWVAIFAHLLREEKTRPFSVIHEFSMTRPESRPTREEFEDWVNELSLSPNDAEAMAKLIPFREET